MTDEILKEIEKVFRTSNSSDELFDTFRIAIENKVNDEQLYKILLRNKALSADEIAMYSEKICKEFPSLCYNVFKCTAQIYESISSYAKHHYRALKYYKKAAEINPETFEPYVSIIRMYNKELNLPKLEDVRETVLSGMKTVKIKSKIYFALSSLYKNLGNDDDEKKYQKLGEKHQKQEHEEN